MKITQVPEGRELRQIIHGVTNNFQWLTSTMHLLCARLWWFRDEKIQLLTSKLQSGSHNREKRWWASSYDLLIPTPVPTPNREDKDKGHLLVLCLQQVDSPDPTPHPPIPKKGQAFGRNGRPSSDHRSHLIPPRLLLCKALPSLDPSRT